MPKYKMLLAMCTLTCDCGLLSSVDTLFSLSQQVVILAFYSTSFFKLYTFDHSSTLWVFLNLTVVHFDNVSEPLIIESRYLR